MNITYESHYPIAIEVIPFNDRYKVVAKFKLNCGLIVTQEAPTLNPKEECPFNLGTIEKILKTNCFFEVRRCNSGVMASAIYIDEDQTCQYIRGASPLEIMHSGFGIGVSPNGDD